MKKRVTLKDLAEATGVHVSTVSRALDPKRDTPLSDEVLSKVQRAAEQLGYRPNRVASSLRTQKTMTVGVVIPDITNLIFPPILRGIESVLEPLGYAAIIVNTDSQPIREKRLIEILQDRGVDGIIHSAVVLDDTTILHASEAGLPIVTLNRRVEGSSIPYVINDEEAGINAAFATLWNRGHRRIAHLAGPHGLSTGQMRNAAFVQSAVRHGLSIDDLTIVEAEHFDERDGRYAASRILMLSPETTAILCSNDRLALGAIEYLRSIGLSCPKDVSVTGFNDMPLLEKISPRLTTVRIKQYEAGVVAARILGQLMTGRSNLVPVRTVLPVELIERDSVATCHTLD
ncbi:LacI family DNA-binding transcriptional regulator [Arenibacterium sp. LLYu02]|uniref:LacI family DNA-binding transcriptional regulator n=1 Tax=Arenibacterium sp. LLYu02 TaxID=3404132 RepID=UPI003B215E00